MILPTPSSEALAHQQKLLDFLEQCCLENNGWLSFADFMQQVLYAPGLGYYSAGMAKFGEAGDFVTAPEISPLFSQCLGNQCLQILEILNDSEVCLLELGAGSGVMAGEILQFLKEKERLPQTYFILEVSADLKQRQQHYLKAHYPDFFEKIVWLERLPSQPFKGIILANEVLDAMPVHRFQIGEHEILEEFVGKENGQWVSRFQPTTHQALQRAVVALQQTLSEPLPVGYTSEINLQLNPWLHSFSRVLEQGVMLFIDYGFPRHEFYHPSRLMGTLMCHYRHHAHPSPLAWIGLQDITAHVDFTALAEASENCDLMVSGFTHQGAFLLNNDLLNLGSKSNIEPLRRSQQIQQLTQPHEMGELFKVMALSKNFFEPLQGFLLFDQLHRL